MNRLKKLIPVLAFAIFSLTAFANHSDNTTDQELRQEISKALSKLDLSNTDFDEETVDVSFMVNEKNQLIVISTDNEKLDGIIKQRLNYKTLKTVQPAMNKLYILPVRVQSK